MESPDKCEHDYRRLYPSDLRWRAGGSPSLRVPRSGVLAVVCCRCGKSPIYDLRNDQPVGARATGEWPVTHRVTAYYQDEIEGPSVEFKIVEAVTDASDD